MLMQIAGSLLKPRAIWNAIRTTYNVINLQIKWDFNFNHIICERVMIAFGDICCWYDLNKLWIIFCVTSTRACCRRDVFSSTKWSWSNPERWFTWVLATKFSRIVRRESSGIRTSIVFASISCLSVYRYSRYVIRFHDIPRSPSTFICMKMYQKKCNNDLL